jgi:hypothetical protein
MCRGPGCRDAQAPADTLRQMSEQPPLRGDNQWRNEVVRIADLTVHTSTIEGQEFSDAHLGLDWQAKANLSHPLSHP